MKRAALSYSFEYGTGKNVYHRDCLHESGLQSFANDSSFEILVIDFAAIDNDVPVRSSTVLQRPLSLCYCD